MAPLQNQNHKDGWELLKLFLHKNPLTSLTLALTLLGSIRHIAIEVDALSVTSPRFSLYVGLIYLGLSFFVFFFFRNIMLRQDSKGVYVLEHVTGMVNSSGVFFPLVIGFFGEDLISWLIDYTLKILLAFL